MQTQVIGEPVGDRRAFNGVRREGKRRADGRQPWILFPIKRMGMCVGERFEGVAVGVTACVSMSRLLFLS